MSVRLNNGQSINSPNGDKYVMAKLLVDAMEKLGRPLTFEEARSYPEMPADINQYAYYFGSFSQACKKVKRYMGIKEEPEKYLVHDERSYAQRAIDSRDFQAKHIRESAEKSMEKSRRWKMEKREEILKRVLDLSFEEHNGKLDWINEQTIKQDPILVLAEVMKYFGGIKQLRQAAKNRLWEEKHGKKPEDSEKVQEVIEMAEEKKPTRKNWTEDEVKKLVRDFYDKNGSLPTDKWFAETENVPSPMTARKYLGNTKKKWLEAIGVEIPKEPETQVPQAPKKFEEVTENGKILDEIVELIGEAGKIAQIAENADILDSFVIARDYTLNYGGIEVAIKIAAIKVKNTQAQEE